MTRLESPESSSPIVTRAVAAALGDRAAQTYSFSPIERLALRLLGYLPQGAARFAISRFEPLNALPLSLVENLSIDQLAQERLRDYAGLSGPFPAITLGAALGGASAHLALALGGPFLPQAFVLTLRGGSPNGDVLTYYRRSAALAQRIAQRDPSVLTIQHYDPVHDEWMTRSVNHLRLKLLDLPASYQDFIRRNLQPGGAICYLDSQARWLRYRTGERSVFQVGGWGDLTPEEFLEGSPRLEAYSRRVNLATCGWQLPGFPIEEGPESEWGCEPGLGSALENFCRQEGYRFVRISLPQPHDYSRLAFRAVQEQLARQSSQPSGVLVEMFSQFDASAVLQGGLLPVWLVFNTTDSLAFLREMRPDFPDQKPVFFSPLSTFTHTPDIVPWEEWEAALSGLEWVNIGARPSHYPGDSHALLDWARPLKSWVQANPNPIRGFLSAEDLKSISQRLNQEPARLAAYQTGLRS